MLALLWSLCALTHAFLMAAHEQHSHFTDAPRCTAHPEIEVQWSGLRLLALPQGCAAFCKAELGCECQKNPPCGMGQPYPLMLGEPGFLPTKLWGAGSTENKVEDTQDTQGQACALPRGFNDLSRPSEIHFPSAWGDRRGCCPPPFPVRVV